MARNMIKVEVDDFREILRRISPYVIRQWKEVCRDLGVPETEMTEVEKNSYTTSLSNLAFKGLCLWYERAGKTASKEKLTGVLKQNGLRRAEEEVNKIEVRELIVRPSSSRVTSARRKKSATPRSTGEHQRPSSRQSQRNGRAKSARVRSAKRKEIKGDKSCDLYLRLKVTHIAAQEELSGLWRDKWREICDAFYCHVMDNCADFILSLEKAIDMIDVTVSDIKRDGVITACVQCATLGALESLNQMYTSRRLLSLCQAVFVNDSVLKHVGVKSLTLDLSINENEMDTCREHLLTRKFKNTTLHPTDTLLAPNDELSVDGIPIIQGISMDTDVNIEESLFRLRTNLESITLRHSIFIESRDEFLRTLQIALPKDKSSLSSLSDLIQLYSYLVSSERLGSGVRTDLVREYLAIVNKTRLSIEKFRDEMDFYLHDISDEEDNLGAVKRLLSVADDMLQPDYKFKEDFSALDRKLTPFEQTFSGLVCFIPLLLDKLSSIILTLTK